MSDVPMTDTPAGLAAMSERERDAAHAVALERERIAAWHERMADQAREIARHTPPDSNRRQALIEDFAVHISSARAIRDGAHNDEYGVDPSTGGGA